jgi:predicted nucleic acid-binding Zn ribbon protein
MASESISKLLGTNPEIQPIAARLKDIERLQERWRSIVPGPLAAASRVCAIEGTVVVICAPNGAIASALRQVAPRLLEALRETRNSPKHSMDQDITSIRIEVQVTASQRRKAAKPRGEVPRDKLAEVSRQLAESPLKEALERMSQTKKSRSTR